MADDVEPGVPITLDQAKALGPDILFDIYKAEGWESNAPTRKKWKDADWAAQQTANRKTHVVWELVYDLTASLEDLDPHHQDVTKILRLAVAQKPELMKLLPNAAAETRTVTEIVVEWEMWHEDAGIEDTKVLGQLCYTTKTLEKCGEKENRFALDVQDVFKFIMRKAGTLKTPLDLEEKFHRRNDLKSAGHVITVTYHDDSKEDPDEQPFEHAGFLRRGSTEPDWEIDKFTPFMESTESAKDFWKDQTQWARWSDADRYPYATLGSILITFTKVCSAEALASFLEADDDPGWQTPSPYKNDYKSPVPEPRTPTPPPQRFLGIESPEGKKKRRPKLTQQQRDDQSAMQTRLIREFLTKQWDKNRYIQRVRTMPYRKAKIEVRLLAKVVREIGRIEHLPKSELKKHGITIRITYQHMQEFVGRDAKWIGAAVYAYRLQAYHGPGGRDPNSTIVQLMTTNTRNKAYGMETWRSRLHRASITNAEERVQGVGPAAPRPVQRSLIERHKPGRDLLPPQN